MKFSRALMICFPTAAAFLAGACTSEPPPPERHRLVVRALVDGAAYLNVRGNEIWWTQLTGERPGVSEKVEEPTLLNDIEWRPDWSKGKVSVPASFSPPIPAAASAVTVTPLRARWRFAVVQTPGAANSDTITLLFDDDQVVGADWYEVALEW
jgi:hypothetical protein